MAEAWTLTFDEILATKSPRYTRQDFERTYPIVLNRGIHCSFRDYVLYCCPLLCVSYTKPALTFASLQATESVLLSFEETAFIHDPLKRLNPSIFTIFDQTLLRRTMQLYPQQQIKL